MEYIVHFKNVDKKIFELISKFGEINFSISHKKSFAFHFENLVSSIIGQQLSLKAARTIEQRVKLILKNEITPESILDSEDDDLRKTGLSYSKISYIKNLSNSILNGKLDLRTVDVLSDDEVITVLTKVKGIGKWTAEMFLIFSLKRPDVFSLTDVGLLNSIKKLYGDRLSKDEILTIINKWKPYRSYAAIYLWKSLDNDSE